MRKIPTILKRDPSDLSRVTDTPNPACQWVFNGEGVATRKYDGTCVLIRGGTMLTRREVKPGKAQPDRYEPIETDPVTGKTVGWEPYEQSGYRDVLIAAATGPRECNHDGTYELCGPKINRNREGFDSHVLVCHTHAAHLPEPGPGYGAPRTVDQVRATVHDAADYGAEGAVWHHPDGRMGKLKARDLRGG